jgi:hypothetical protein
MLMNCDVVPTTPPLVTYENSRGKRNLILHRPDAFRNPGELMRRRQRSGFITWTESAERGGGN